MVVAKAIKYNVSINDGVQIKMNTLLLPNIECKPTSQSLKLKQEEDCVTIFVRNYNKRALKFNFQSKVNTAEFFQRISKKMLISEENLVLFLQGNLVQKQCNQIQLQKGFIFHAVDIKRVYLPYLNISVKRIQPNSPVYHYKINSQLKIGQFMHNYMSQQFPDISNYFLVYTGRQLAHQKTFLQQMVEEYSQIQAVHKIQDLKSQSLNLKKQRNRLSTGTIKRPKTYQTSKQKQNLSIGEYRVQVNNRAEQIQNRQKENRKHDRTNQQHDVRQMKQKGSIDEDQGQMAVELFETAKFNTPEQLKAVSIKAIREKKEEEEENMNSLGGQIQETQEYIIDNTKAFSYMQKRKENIQTIQKQATDKIFTKYGLVPNSNSKFTRNNEQQTLNMDSIQNSISVKQDPQQDADNMQYRQYQSTEQWRQQVDDLRHSFEKQATQIVRREEMARNLLANTLKTISSLYDEEGNSSLRESNRVNDGLDEIQCNQSIVQNSVNSLRYRKNSGQKTSQIAEQPIVENQHLSQSQSEFEVQQQGIQKKGDEVNSYFAKKPSEVFEARASIESSKIIQNQQKQETQSKNQQNQPKLIQQMATKQMQGINDSSSKNVTYFSNKLKTKQNQYISRSLSAASASASASANVNGYVQVPIHEAKQQDKIKYNQPIPKHEKIDGGIKKDSEIENSKHSWVVSSIKRTQSFDVDQEERVSETNKQIGLERERIRNVSNFSEVENYQIKKLSQNENKPNNSEPEMMKTSMQQRYENEKLREKESDLRKYPYLSGISETSSVYQDSSSDPNSNNHLKDSAQLQSYPQISKGNLKVSFTSDYRKSLDKQQDYISQRGDRVVEVESQQENQIKKDLSCLEENDHEKEKQGEQCNELIQVNKSSGKSNMSKKNKIEIVESLNGENEAYLLDKQSVEMNNELNIREQSDLLGEVQKLQEQGKELSNLTVQTSQLKQLPTNFEDGAHEKTGEYEQYMKQQGDNQTVVNSSYEYITETKAAKQQSSHQINNQTCQQNSKHPAIVGIQISNRDIDESQPNRREGQFFDQQSILLSEQKISNKIGSEENLLQSLPEVITSLDKQAATNNLQQSRFSELYEQKDNLIDYVQNSHEKWSIHKDKQIFNEDLYQGYQMYQDRCNIKDKKQMQYNTSKGIEYLEKISLSNQSIDRIGAGDVILIWSKEQLKQKDFLLELKEINLCGQQIRDQIFTEFDKLEKGEVQDDEIEEEETKVNQVEGEDEQNLLLDYL